MVILIYFIKNGRILDGTFVNINIFLLKIHSFENASAVNIVENLLADWCNFDKSGQNF